MKHDAVRIGAIHIIESLGSEDLQTGTRLRDQLGPLTESSSPPISVDFWTEPTRKGFLARLQHILADVRLRRLAPVVHIETHGSPEGLYLTSGDVVTWSDLKAPFTDINVTCRLNLLVLVGACDGAGLTKIIQAQDRAPVWGLIGPSRPVTPWEIEAAHTAFYRTLFSTGDGAVAWRAMNAAIEASDSPFLFVGAEYMFREVMRMYFKEHCSNEQLANRTQKLVDLAKNRGMPDERLPLFAAKMDEHLRDYQAIFGRTKEHFFHQDLCPEHAERFNVALAECLGTGEQSL
jgi:hypothetical protein